MDQTYKELEEEGTRLIKREIKKAFEDMRKQTKHIIDVSEQPPVKKLRRSARITSKVSY
jgi:hypothetical protein